MKGEACVVGAGVNGLSCALRLSEAGWRVRMLAALPAERTTSAVAAAIWYPYHVGPAGAVAAWGERGFRELQRLSGVAGSGVRMVPGVELLAPGTSPQPFPLWAAGVPGFRAAGAGELPAGRSGWAFTVPVAGTALYLRWLAARVAAAGVVQEWGTLRALEEAPAGCELVVNCAGLGARELVPDAALFPVRGQVVRVRNPGIGRFWLDDHHPEGLLYIIPRGDDCILGGTAQRGSEALQPDAATAQAILRRCAELEAGLREAEVLEHRVGLRPGRPEVRLEAGVLQDGRRVIHNYGHGGAGVTLSWGCADAVVELAG
jgi:D-amino-acid oxidase